MYTKKNKTAYSYKDKLILHLKWENIYILFMLDGNFNDNVFQVFYVLNMVATIILWNYKSIHLLKLDDWCKL